MKRAHRRYLRREGTLAGTVISGLLFAFVGPTGFAAWMLVLFAGWLWSLVIDTNDLPLFAPPEAADPVLEVLDLTDPTRVDPGGVLTG